MSAVIRLSNGIQVCPVVNSLVCVGEHVTCPVVSCQAVPSTRCRARLVIRATI